MELSYGTIYQLFSFQKEDQEEDHKEDQSDKSEELLPGSSSSVPCTDTEQLTTSHDGLKFFSTAPHVTFKSGCWNRTPVTVKTMNKIYYQKAMEKDMEMLRYVWNAGHALERHDLPIAHFRYIKYSASFGGCGAVKLNNKEMSSYSLGSRCNFSCFSFTASD
jgi:hypothetical protein